MKYVLKILGIIIIVGRLLELISGSSSSHHPTVNHRSYPVDHLRDQSQNNNNQPIKCLLAVLLFQ